MAMGTSELSIKIDGEHITGVVKGDFLHLSAAIAGMLRDKPEFRFIVFAAVNRVILTNDSIMQEWNEIQLASAEANEIFKKK